MALRALKNSHPDRDSTQSLLRKPAMDLLKEVYSDFNQDIQVRAAALLSFISWQPSTNFWNKLAQNTWNDPSKDFSSFSSNLINLYANKKFPAPEKQWKDAYYCLEISKTFNIFIMTIQAVLSSIFSSKTTLIKLDLFLNITAKLILGVNEKIPPSFENFFFEILTKENDLSLLKFENYALFSKAYEKPKSGTPHYEFFTKFMGSIPVTFSFTSKRNFPRKPGQVFSNQYLVKASAVHTRGVGVYLPWSFKSHNAMIQSSLEYNIPVRTMEESYPETEGMVRTFKTRFNIGFEKKFPALRLSKTPMTITYYFDPVSHNPVINFVPIKKFDIEEKVISEVDPFTGIKYDLNLRADTKSDFGLNDFLKFPK
ncbi:hypothetical protein Avbf_17723 [Armadillidium vulgare]|nr:hypothetical protein Avbf_17723 [Armadillidium vulgare]